MIRWLPIVAVSLFMGMVIGSGAKEDVRQFSGQIFRQKEQSELVRCSYEVDRSGWKHFRSDKEGFELFLPASYSLKEEDGLLVLKPADAEFPRIEFTKLRERLSDVMKDTPYQFAGYKVQDRQNLVLASPYFSEDADTVTSTYLFSRDFQIAKQGTPVVIIRAVIRDSGKNAAFMKAHAEGIVDIESVLTEAEQILSTFRFLSYQELYGPEGR